MVVIGSGGSKTSSQLKLNIADSAIGPSGIDRALLDKRLALQGKVGGFPALFQNARVFGIASFACLGGLLYGYNQGVFSGLLTMTNFGSHMGVYTVNQVRPLELL